MWVVLATATLFSALDATAGTNRTLSRKQKALVGTWVTNVNVQYRITENGTCIDPSTRDTLATMTVIAEDTLRIDAEDGESRFHLEIGNGYFIISKDEGSDISVRVPDEPMAADEIAKRLAGEWRIVRFFGYHLERMAGKFTEANVLFTNDTARVYADGKVVDEWHYTIEDGRMEHQQYGAPLSHVLLFDGDTLTLGAFARLVRRKTPFEKKPHVVTYNENPAGITLHEVMPVHEMQALLDSLRAAEGTDAGLVVRDSTRVTFSRFDSAVVAELLASEIARDLLKQYKPFYIRIPEAEYRERHTLAVYFLDTTVALSGNLIQRVEARDHLLMPGHVQFTMQLSPEGTQAFAALTQENLNRFLAVCANGRLDVVPIVRSKVTTGRFDLRPYPDSGDDWKSAWPRYKEEYGLR